MQECFETTYKELKLLQMNPIHFLLICFETTYKELKLLNKNERGIIAFCLFWDYL